MLIPLGILNFPISAGNYDLLETEILTGTQAEIEFSSLSSTYGSTYQHLQLRSVIKTNQSSGSALYANIIMRLNSDTGSNYSVHRLSGNGSSVSSGGGSSLSYGLDIPAAGNSSTHYSPSVIDILDPFETSKNTTIRALAGRLESTQIGLYSGAWYNTDAVNTITLDISQAASFVSGSRFSLYGLRS